MIGRRDGKLWIATAAHVVFHPPWDRFKAFKTIEVRQQDSLAVQAIVDGPTTGNARVDLALIAVPARPLELFFTAIAAPPLTKGQEVWLGGVTGRFEYHSKVGKFEGLDPGSGVYRVKEMHGLPASSGGIAVTRAGVIGLYIVDSGDSSVVPMEAVQKTAFDRNVPFDLVDSGIRIGGELDPCVVNDGPENVKLHLIADKRYALDSQGCVHGPVQPYRVFADDLNVVCRPPDVTPSPTTARFRVTCEPRLTGIWLSPLGGVEIKELENGIVTFSGLDLSRGGALQGELRGQPSYLTVLGKSASGQMVTGVLVAERRHITGTLNFVDGSQSVQLTR